jgi:hypothetical protein
MTSSCPCRTRECRWSNVQIVEKKSRKMKLSTATCAERPYAKNAEPPDYAPNAPNSGPLKSTWKTRKQKDSENTKGVMRAIIAS